MRWLIFLLLVEGFLFNLSAFDPATAGQAGWLWPFAADSKPIVSLAGGLPGQPGSVVAPFLAGAACLFFLAALVGLFWQALPTNWWPVLVILAVIASLLLYVLFFATQMTVPILVDVVLIWGVLTKRWSADVLRMRTLHNTPVPIYPLMHIPVPWVFVLSYLAGVGLQYLVPITFHSADFLKISRLFGIVLVAGGAALAFSSLGIFRVNHTTTVPFETASSLVTWGPYRITRNPMYVGLTLVYIGVAGILGQVWPLLLMPLLLIYIHRIVIPVEESLLREAFGDTYKLYSARVGRWI